MKIEQPGKLLDQEKINPWENLQGPQRGGEHLVGLKILDTLKDTRLVVPHGPLVEIMDRGQRNIPRHHNEHDPGYFFNHNVCILPRRIICDKRYVEKRATELTN